MYWLLRHAQKAHNINIHKFQPLPEKGMGSADFLHNGTGYTEKIVFVEFLFHANFNHDFNHGFLHSRTQLLEARSTAGTKRTSFFVGTILYNRKLEMWLNAQRDGRPAEYRWRPLFNAAKFG